jgi:hypothetical protein
MTFSYTFTKTGELPYFFADFGGGDEGFVSTDDVVVDNDGNADEVLLMLKAAS